MKTLCSFSDINQAYFSQSILESAGIEARVLGENIPLPGAGLSSPYSLIVAEHDFDQAAALIKDIVSPAPIANIVTHKDDDRLTIAKGVSVRRTLVSMVIVEQILIIFLYFQNNQVNPEVPSDVRAYLISLAASPELWRMGYVVYMLAWGISAAGAIFILCSWIKGRSLYAVGFLFQIATTWVFPGGIVYGLGASLGGVRIALVGAVLALCYFTPVLEADHKAG